MGFGAVFKEAWSTASAAGKQTFQGMATAAANARHATSQLAKRAATAGVEGAKAAGTFVVDAANTVVDAGVESAKAVGTFAVDTANTVVDASVKVVKTAGTAGSFVVRKAAAASLLTGEALVGTSLYGFGKVLSVGNKAYQTTKTAYQDVKEKFFPHQPVATPVMMCLGAEPAAERKTRIEKRNALIEKGRRSSDPATKKAADELKADMKAVEMARLTGNSYDQYDPDKSVEQKKPPEPWHAMSDLEIEAAGLSVEDVKASKAVIYTVPPDFPFEPKTVVAFRGTTGETEDILTDHDQALGLKTDQYEAAKRLGERLGKKMRDCEVTGHSLGGGKAQAAGVAGGLKGQMFNSAGLNPITMNLSSDGLGPYAGNFVQYRAEGGISKGGGDPLTGVQNSPTAQKAVYGAAQGLQGVAQANRWALDELGVEVPWHKLPQSAQETVKGVVDRVLDVTPQEAMKNHKFSGGKWYLPPAVGEVRGLTSKTSEGEDSGIAAQHSVTNLVYGFESRKTGDIQMLLDKTGEPGKASDYVGKMVMK